MSTPESCDRLRMAAPPGERPASKPAHRAYRIAGRLLRAEGSRIVIEFESPADGFEMPEPGQCVRVRRAGESMITARVVEDLTTRGGPLPRGVVCRLALDLPRGKEWALGVVRLEWIRPATPGERLPADLVSGWSDDDVEARALVLFEVDFGE